MGTSVSLPRIPKRLKTLQSAGIRVAHADKSYASIRVYWHEMFTGSDSLLWNYLLQVEYVEVSLERATSIEPHSTPSSPALGAFWLWLCPAPNTEKGGKGSGMALVSYSCVAQYDCLVFGLEVVFGYLKTP